MAQVISQDSIEKILDVYTGMLIKWANGDFKDSRPAYKQAATQIIALIEEARLLGEWDGRLGESAWWHRNYKNPQYKELLAKRYKAIETRHPNKHPLRPRLGVSNGV